MVQVDCEPILYGVDFFLVVLIGDSRTKVEVVKAAPAAHLLCFLLGCLIEKVAQSSFELQ